MTSQELTVGTLTRRIKEVLEEDFRYVRVVGEVSNHKLAASGHHYFHLKDEEAQIRCVMWKSRTPRVRPSDGMRVVVSGKLTVYPPTGGYQ
ncbi:MAG: exodeoxyribonuclease VII large subunit, partial [Candidatus Kapaibacterium sp.]